MTQTAFPSNLEAEQAVLGAIIIENSVINQVMEILIAEDFYKEAHRKIYNAMIELDRDSKPIDLLTLYDYLKGTRNLLEEVGESSYLTYLTEIVPATENVSYYAGLVKNSARKRRLCETFTGLGHKLSSGTIKYEEVHERAIRALTENQNTDFGTACITLANRKVKAREWILESLFPDRFPSIIYGAGGLGKSYLALYLAILACLGGQRFLGYPFLLEMLNVLYVDFELDGEEQAERAQKVARGLNLPDVPTNLYYYEPDKNLLRVLPEIRGLIKRYGIRLVIIDSIGASGTDGESVQDVVRLLTELKNLGIATLVLDHQGKLQAGERYGNKTPFGSVYKENLARSVFQLSREEAKDNRMRLRLRHTKANFSKLADDLVFEMSFEGDMVLFTESQAQTPETTEVELIQETIEELTEVGARVNQKAIIEHLKGKISKNHVISLLEAGEGKHWEQYPGEHNEKLYRLRIPEFQALSNWNSGILKNEQEEYEYDGPEELLDDSINY